jgi:protein O-mannosyl-transferase
VPETRPEPWSWKADGARAALVFALAFACFANSLGNGFVYDDVPIIKDNPRLASPWALKTFFATTYWGPGQPDQALYRPLTIMSFAVDRALFGPGPAGVHAMNVLANGLVAVLLYAFLRQLVPGRRIPLFAALLFSIHPVHTEVVANGVGRAELYGTAAALGAGILHFRSLRPSAAAETRKLTRAERRRDSAPDAAPASDGRWQFPLAIGLYFVSMLFKESPAVLPALLFLLDWLLVAEGKLSVVLKRIGRYALYAIPFIVWLAMRVGVGTKAPAVQEVLAGSTALDRFFFANEVLLRYVGQLLVPLRLVAEYSDYTDPVRRGLTDPLVAAAFACWALVGVAAWMAFKRKNFVLVSAAAWFAVSILPTSNLLFSIGTIRGDRLLFFPSVGFVLALAWALDWVARRNQVVGWVLLAAVLAGYATRTVRRNQDWKSREALWPVTVADIPGSEIAWTYMGDIHRDRGDRPAAEAAYKTAFELRDRLGFAAAAHNGYAALLAVRGDVAGAEAQYRLVIEKQPKQFTALLNLGEMLLRKESTRAEAIALLQRAGDAKPDDFMPRANLAQALFASGRYAEALVAIDAAIRLKPDEADLKAIRAQIVARGGATSR